MKMPIWAWDEEAKRYALFPLELLETFGDGTQGFSFPPNRDNSSRQAAFMKFRKYFEWNPINWRYDAIGDKDYPYKYRLREEQPKEQK